MTRLGLAVVFLVTFLHKPYYRKLRIQKQVGGLFVYTSFPKLWWGFAPPWEGMIRCVSAVGFVG
jgi:hypothetical protein